jgi:hypothetical protein
MGWERRITIHGPDVGSGSLRVTGADEEHFSRKGKLLSQGFWCIRISGIAAVQSHEFGVEGEYYLCNCKICIQNVNT